MRAGRSLTRQTAPAILVRMAGVFDKGAEERYAGLAHVRMPEAAPVARAEQKLA